MCSSLIASSLQFLLSALETCSQEFFVGAAPMSTHHCLLFSGLNLSLASTSTLIWEAGPHNATVSIRILRGATFEDVFFVILGRDLWKIQESTFALEDLLVCCGLSSLDCRRVLLLGPLTNNRSNSG